MHATIPNGNMGYAQYTVPGFVAVEPTFVAFLYHSQTYVHGLLCHSINFLSRTVNSKPPTIPFGIVAGTFSDNLSRSSCILRNIFVDKVLREEIPPQNDRQFLKVSMEPHPSVVYLKSSMNQGFD